METIKVNMNPNPLDVQTIHASQNDGEARQWGFELHNNGELIDTSDVKEQLFFKAYKGGTEQILPENTSTPTTSPFKGDIKYPQGLLSDQEFLYRESPTEEDGLAKITDIKGNTLVWNQQNYDNFTDATKWWLNDGSKYSVSVSNNVLTVTCTGTPDGNGSVRISGVNSIAGHKYLLLADVKSPKAVGFRYLYSPIASGSLSMSVPANVWTQFGKVVQINSSSGFYIYFNSNNALAQGDVVEIKNHQIIDLTQMFGTTKADEIYAMEQAQSGSGIAYFKTYYPLPYYSYNQGTLLSFNGNGIKTVGFNLFDPTSETFNAYLHEIATNNVRWTYEADSRSVAIRCFPNTTYCIYANGLTPSILRVCSIAEELPSGTGWDIQCEKQFVNSTTGMTIFTTGANAKYLIVQSNRATFEDIKVNLCISLSSDKNGTYEPYKEETLSLPISQYFPNGMKSAGSVYDELTPTKAITRIGAVDLGSLVWNKTSGTTSEYDFFETQYPIPTVGGTLNVLCPLYKTVNDMTSSSGENKAVRITGTSSIRIRDLSYTDISTFTSAMSGVYLYYELATPTETSFTTASLVTENVEIPLSNEDGVLIGKCTEQLSSESGFIDAKIKLADEDGECYSNKLQLHVERKPS